MTHSSQTIAENDWIWHGKPGHFVAAYACCFRLHTTVGKYRVSTVGCYHPADDPQGEPHEVGSGRLYETMVFQNASHGEPDEWCELDSAAYSTDDEAENGHYVMCGKWAGL